MLSAARCLPPLESKTLHGAGHPFNNAVTGASAGDRPVAASWRVLRQTRPSMPSGARILAAVKVCIVLQGLFLDTDGDRLVGRAENGMLWTWDLSRTLGWQSQAAAQRSGSLGSDPSAPWGGGGSCGGGRGGGGGSGVDNGIFGGSGSAGFTAESWLLPGEGVGCWLTTASLPEEVHPHLSGRKTSCLPGQLWTCTESWLILGEAGVCWRCLLPACQLPAPLSMLPCDADMSHHAHSIAMASDGISRTQSDSVFCYRPSRGSATRHFRDVVACAAGIAAQRHAQHSPRHQVEHSEHSK